MRTDGFRVGVTYDIIGNVQRPYVIVRLDSDVTVAPSDQLYVVIPQARPPRHRRGRRLRRR